MHQLNSDQLTELLKDQQAPCVSLYQPTHRHAPDNQQDPIRYRNLLRAMEGSLLQKSPAKEVKLLLEKFEPLARDADFWNHRTDGLAILASPEKFQIFELQRTVPELVVVADSFHTKPLLRALQSADRYQILYLNRQTARLYEGNRYALDPVELLDFPTTITDALGEELTEPHQTVASYGKGSSAPGGAHGESAMHHGHGQKKDEVENDMERFFRVIDRGILQYHSRVSGLPLMLATLPEYQSPFRKLSQNPFLMAGGISRNFEADDLDRLREESWRIMQPHYLQRLAQRIDEYQIARSRKLGEDDLQQVAKAAIEGRVGSLMVEDEREVPGKIDRVTGEIRPGDFYDPEVGDILDDLAEAVLRMDGDVIVVPKERMPTTSGAAATYRF